MADVALRPRGILEILDASFALLRRDYLKLVTIMAVVSLPYQLVSLLWMQEFISAVMDPGASSVSTAVQVGGTVMPFFGWLVWYPFVDAAVMYAASEGYMGRDVSVAEALNAVVRRFVPLLGIVCLKGLALLVGLVALVVPGVYVYLRYFAAVQAVMVEDAGTVAAMRRSGTLTKGFKWKTLGTMLLVYIIYSCLTLLPALPLLFVQNVVLMTMLGALASILLYPMYPVAATLLYYDMRVRKEGLDIEMLAQDLQAPPAAHPAV